MVNEIRMRQEKKPPMCVYDELLAQQGGRDAFSLRYIQKAIEKLRSEDMADVLAKKIESVLAQREEILTAFVAKYGFEPERAMQVERCLPDGTQGWCVVRMTDEQMAEMSKASSGL